MPQNPTPSVTPGDGPPSGEARACATRRWTGPEGTAPPPAPLAWIVPTTTDAFFIACVLATVYTQANGYLSSDTGWHLAAGEWILGHGFPAGDPFTWTHRGATWHLWEWLWEVVAALIVRAAGLPGLIVAAAALVVLPFAIVHERLRRREIPAAISLPVCALALAAAMIHAMARPHVASWLGVTAMAILIDRMERIGRSVSATLAMALALQVAWVNTHSGFVYGLTMVAAAWAASLLGPADPAPARRPAPWGRLLCALLLVSLINPQGIAALTDVVGHLHASIVDITQEFRSPDFHTLGRPFGLMLGLTLALIGLSPARLTGREGLLIGVFTMAALYSARNIPIAAIVLAMPLARLATALLDAWTTRECVHAAHRATRGAARALGAISWRIGVMDAWVVGTVPSALLLVVLIVLARRTAAAGAGPLPSGFPEETFPVAAVAAARQAHLSDRLFNELHWGGYITWATGGEVPVYVDNRSLLYEPEFLDEYFAIAQAAGAWDQAVERRGIRWFLIPSASPLAAALAGRPAQWERLHKDALAVIYVAASTGRPSEAPASDRRSP